MPERSLAWSEKTQKEEGAMGTSWCSAEDFVTSSQICKVCFPILANTKWVGCSTYVSHLNVIFIAHEQQLKCVSVE